LYLCDPILLDSLQPYNRSDSPHVNAKLSADDTHALAFLNDTPVDFLSHRVVEYGLGFEEVIERKGILHVGSALSIGLFDVLTLFGSVDPVFVIVC
jgi:hypothetical protein